MPQRLSRMAEMQFIRPRGIYGIGCDPFNESSVENIFKVKGRDLTKNFIILTSKYKLFEKNNR
jgi:tRNA A37 threonylcarbamoyladenosine synthetase subunit TsaC/SUA5/YrdC